MRPAESALEGAVATSPPAERIDYASILSPQTKWIVLAGVLMGLFLAALDQTIVATALPAIIADLRGIDLLAWVSTGYLPLSTTTVPVYAKLSLMHSGQRETVDWAGTLLLIASVVPLLLALTLDKQQYPWSSPAVVALLMAATVATALLLIVESRVPSPIISLDLFRNRTFAVVSVASMLVAASFFAAIFFLSIFMVNVVGVSATAAGTTLIPLTFAVVIGAFTSSLIVQRLGRYRRIVLAGFTVAVIGFGLLAALGPDATRWDVTWRMIVLGMGLGPAMPLLNLVVQNAVPYEKVGLATAARQFFLQIGAALGPAAFAATRCSG